MLASRARHLCAATVGRPSVLAGLLRAVDRSPATYTTDDVYKLAALLRGKEDVLGLRDTPEFLRGFRRRCDVVLDPSHSADINPFQRTLLESVLPTVALVHSETMAEHASAPTSAQSLLLQEHINAIGAIAREVRQAHHPSDDDGAAQKPTDNTSTEPDTTWQPYVSSEAVREVEAHMSLLVERVRDLGPQDVQRLASSLVTVRYQNYGHTALLARRACEVCRSLPRKELVWLFVNLNKLQVQDSLHPLVNAIAQQVGSLEAEETYRLLHALELQAHTNAASLKLVGPLVQHAVQKHLATATAANFHRALVVVLAQYQQAQQQHVLQAVMRSLMDPAKAHLAHAKPRDLIVILQCLIDLQVPPAALARYTALFEHLEQSISTMDLRDIDNLLDIVSLLPIDSAAIMTSSLARLDKDAGKLTIPQLTFILDLLSTYPPAKKDVAIVSLAYTAAVQSHAMDAATLQKVLVSLATLERFSEDFVTLLRVLVCEKGGFRQGAAHLVAILTALQPQNLRENPELAPLLKQALADVVGNMTEVDLVGLRKACAKSGLAEDKAVITLLSSAARPGTRFGNTGWQTSPPRGTRGRRPRS